MGRTEGSLLFPSNEGRPLTECGKQVTKLFQKKILTKRALREIKCVGAGLPPSLANTGCPRATERHVEKLLLMSFLPLAPRGLAGCCITSVVTRTCVAHLRLATSQVFTGCGGKKRRLTSSLHAQITCLYDLDLVDPVNFDSVYLYEECMEADLHAIASRIYATRVKEDPIRLTTNERADRFDPDNPSRTRISRASSTRLFAV